MKTLLIVAILVIVVFLGYFILANLKHRRRIRNMKLLTEFNLQLISWSKEIKDPLAQKKFIKEEIERIIYINTASTESLENFDIKKEKMNIYTKWSKHIPSLLQEVRNQRLNKIL